MTDTKKYKLLPTGEDTFSEVITQNKYYVDKTSYLRSVFAEDGSSVLLFTRPRRFGKTMLMDMFAMPYKAVVLRLFESGNISHQQAEKLLEVGSADGRAVLPTFSMSPVRMHF